MAHSPRLQRASDFAPEVLHLFDQYVHGLIDRRGFLDGAARYATAGVSAAGLLAALSPRFAQAQQVSPSDARIRAESIEISSPQGYGKLRGLLVRPRSQGSERLPAVLVVHENRGLNPHIEDIARRLAIANFIAFAPDALTPFDGYPGNEDEARELFAQLDSGKTREDFVAAARFMKALAGSNGRLGALGFCWGGGVVNMLATRVSELDAGVPFYGPAPALDAVPTIHAELLLHFAQDDERVNAGWPAYEAALKAAQVRYTAYSYPGTQHGFNNDTTPRYDDAAARLAWQRTLAFLNRTLRARSG
ncbi:MAG TPA: dienelactone hydrolase family protein [Albitalea sp.]|nr:dienelactone hydrolase family protein [Albitalea sp.]